METPNKDEKKLPKLTPKNLDGSQRVIKQIMVIDPNKLRVAGLDLKMAEALKKSKVRAPNNSFAVRSKDDKLAIAKSILNKKLKQAQMSGELAKRGALNQETVKKPIDKVSFSNATKVAATKAHIKVAALKSLMPPPASPISPLPSKSCTMLLNFLKSDKKTGSIELNIVDPLLGPTKKTSPEQISKSSSKGLKGNKVQEEISKTVESRVISPGVTFEKEEKSESSVVEVAIPFKVLPNVLPPQVKEAQKTIHIISPGPRKLPTTTVGRVLPHRDSQNPSAKNMFQGSQEHFSKELTSAPHNQLLTTTESNVQEKETPKATHILPNPRRHFSPQVAPLSSKQLPTVVLCNTSPLQVKGNQGVKNMSPQKHLPKVIESKVLSPEEKIDLSTLCVKSSTKVLTGTAPLPVSKQLVYKQQDNLVLSKAEETNKNIQKAKASPQNVPQSLAGRHPSKNTLAKPVIEESAVDFINSLKFMRDTQSDAYTSKSELQEQATATAEDATTFLMSFFGQQTTKSLNKQSIFPPLESAKNTPEQITITTEAQRSDKPKKSEQPKPKCVEKLNLTSVSTSSAHVITTPSRVSGEEYTPGSSMDAGKEPINKENLKLPLDARSSTYTYPISASCTHEIKHPSSKSNLVDQSSKLQNNSPANLTKVNQKDLTSKTNETPVDNPAPNPLGTETKEEAPSCCALTPTVSTRRKGKKSVPVLIATLNKNRKPPASQVKPSISKISGDAYPTEEASTSQQIASGKAEETPEASQRNVTTMLQPSVQTNESLEQPTVKVSAKQNITKDYRAQAGSPLAIENRVNVIQQTMFENSKAVETSREGEINTISPRSRRRKQRFSTQNSKFNIPTNATDVNESNVESQSLQTEEQSQNQDEHIEENPSPTMPQDFTSERAPLTQNQGTVLPTTSQESRIKTRPLPAVNEAKSPHSITLEGLQSKESGNTSNVQDTVVDSQSTDQELILTATNSVSESGIKEIESEEGKCNVTPESIKVSRSNSESNAIAIFPQESKTSCQNVSDEEVTKEKKVNPITKPRTRQATLSKSTKDSEKSTELNATSIVTQNVEHMVVSNSSEQDKVSSNNLEDTEVPDKADNNIHFESRSCRSRKKTAKFEEYSKGVTKIPSKISTQNVDSSRPLKSDETSEAKVSDSVQIENHSDVIQPKRTRKLVKGLINLVDRKKINSSELLENKTVSEDIVCPSEKASFPTDGSAKMSDNVDGCKDMAMIDFGTAAEQTVKNDSHQVKASVESPVAAMEKISPKKEKTKSPLKKTKSISKEGNASPNDESDFLGFNEKEIEEAQELTTLRLSQSEEITPLPLSSPPAGSGKKKSSPRIKKEPLSTGKKRKTEVQKWQKNSAVSLKNWLTTSDKNTEAEAEFSEGNVKQEANEINPSNPSKKEDVKLPQEVEKIKTRDTKLGDEEGIPKSDVNTIQKQIIDTSKKRKKGSVATFNSAFEDDVKLEPPSQSESKIGTKSKDQETSTKTQRKNRRNQRDGIKSEYDERPPEENELSTLESTKTIKPPSKPERRKCNIRKSASSIEADVKPLPGPVDHLTTPSNLRNRKRKREAVEENTPKSEPPTKLLLLTAEDDSNFISPTSKRSSRLKLEASICPRKPIYTPVVPVSPLERKYKNDTEFNPRLLLIRQKEDLKTDVELIDPDIQTAPKNKDDVQCALCMGYTAKKKWVQHISGHYGVGWIMGTPPPLNVKSRASVLNFMVEFFKTSKVKGLNCRLCQAQRRSALGLLVHLEQCCLTEDELKESRVDCEHCNNNYSKTSIIIHLRTCSALLKKSRIEEEDEPKPANTTVEEEILSNTGRLKRKSVIKAEIKFKNLDDVEFIPDELIKHIPSQRTDTFPSTWLREIKSFGKGFCVQKKCPFTATTVEELLHHSQDKICSFFVKPGYWCKKCKFHGDQMDTVRNHVVEHHKPKPPKDLSDSENEAEIGSESSSESVSSGDEERESEVGSGNDGSNDEKKRKRKKKSNKTKSKSKAVRAKWQKSGPTKDFKKLLPDRDPNIAARVAKWYEKFVEENFSKEPLFTFATPNATSAKCDGFESYFPKSPVSMKFLLNGFNGFVKEFGRTQVKPEQWQRLERLKGTELSSEHAMYVGGPVKFLAWVPMEPSPPSSTQYLAVVTRKGIDKFTSFLKPKHSRSLVYIIKYHIKESAEICGEIQYALPIDVGPIHCIEFLPSGGYAPGMNRLGLLAVGTVETEIKIFSLPIEEEKRDCDIFPIVRLEPAFKLCLESVQSPNEYSDEYQSQCIQLVWSQTADHNFIIGGYLNGFVAIWDISDEDDNLNRFVVNGFRKFVPVSYFWTLDNRIQLAVHYDVNGLRWLAVYNFSRKLLIYDLREITKPILFYADTTKNVCNSINWPIVWENLSYGLGDTMPSHGNVINTVSPMSLVFTNRRFDKFCCGVNDIHFNVWGNMYAAGAENGDIHIVPLREAILDVGLRTKNDEKLISTLDIVALDGDVISEKTSQELPDGWRLFETDCKEKYGLVFSSIKKIVGAKKPLFYSEKRIPPLSLSRLMRVNRLRFNPNRTANNFLAVGYDNGLLRVLQSDWHTTSKET